MSSNATRRLEAWLVLAAMAAGMVWYANPQIAYPLQALRQLASLALVVLGR